MVSRWEPGTQYEYGAVVEYHSVAYKIVQPHRSQGDWTPDLTPALWGRMQDQSCVEKHGYDDCGQGHQNQGHYGGPPHQETTQPSYNYGSGGAAPGGAPAPQEEQGWLTDERKKQLEIGGGILAGAALLGGGFAAYQHHKNNQENSQAQAWGQSNWLSEAQARTQAFRAQGPKGPYTWVLTNGKNIPQGAIEGGREDNGKVLYIARTYYEGGIHVGKAGSHLGKGAVIGYGDKEIEIDTYEILLGDTSRVKWTSGASYNSQSVVEGGREQDGTPLLVAQAFYKGGTHPGKFSPKFKGACIAYGGKEKLVEQYQILVVQ